MVFVLPKIKKTYLEPSRTSRWSFFAITIFAKGSIVDVRIVFKYASETFTLTCIVLLGHFIIFTHFARTSRFDDIGDDDGCGDFLNLCYGVNNFLSNGVSSFFEYSDLSGCQSYHQVPGCNLFFK